MTNDRGAASDAVHRRRGGAGRRLFALVTVVALAAGAAAILAAVLAPARSSTILGRAPAGAQGGVPGKAPGGTPSSQGSRTSQPFARPGPFAAGVTTLHLPYAPVEVWYPAARSSIGNRHPDRYDIRDWLPSDIAWRVPPGLAAYTTGAYRNVRAARGTYPLVLFAHGLYSYRDQSTFLTTWLASWGFVVAAPEFPTHDLTEYFTGAGAPDPSGPTDYTILADTVRLVRAASDGTGSGPLRGVVRSGGIGVVGHSLGGLDAIQFAARPDVAIYVALAAGYPPPEHGSGGPSSTLPKKRSLFMVGSHDRDVNPAWVKETFERAPQPTQFVSISGAGHLVFTDMCSIGQSSGGLAALAPLIGGDLPVGAPFTPRALDGCKAGVPIPVTEFADVRQAVISQLRAALLSVPGQRRSPSRSSR